MGKIQEIQSIPSDKQSNADLAELIEKAVAGDTLAFRKIVEIHRRYVLAVALGLLRNTDGAAEVTQDAFVKVWKNLGLFDGRAKFTTWLYKIAVNLCYDRIKAERRRMATFSSMRDQEESMIGPQEDPLTGLMRSDLCRRALAIAATLPPKQHLVFHLRDVNDCDLEEIAEIADMSVGTVKSNLSYARKTIREQLELQDSQSEMTK